MISRRTFLTALSTAAVSACVATQIPTGWLPVASRRLAACEVLRRVFHDYSMHSLNRVPARMYAGRELFEAYESELMKNQRFAWCDAPDEQGRVPLMFKGIRLYERGRGWTAACEAT